MAPQPVKVQEPIRFGEDFELDLAARRLRRGDRVLKVERIPLEIMVLLIERCGQTVPRDEIVARVWGQGAFLDTDNSIRGAIRKIRHALKDDPETAAVYPDRDRTRVSIHCAGCSFRRRTFRGRAQR